MFGAAPDMSKEIAKGLLKIGAMPINFSLSRTGLNPFKDYSSVMELKQIIQDNAIDMVFPYTIKPVIYSSMAANKLGVPVVSLITGLGVTFSSVGTKATIMRKAIEALYKFSIRKNKVVVFQNADDLNLFRTNGILLKKQKTDVVDGSGVNLTKYRTRVNKKTSDVVVFLFVARLIREKGVYLFVEAAKEIKKEFPKAEFHIIGDPDKKAPSAIKLSELTELNKNGTIVYHGFQSNVEDFLYKSDVFVLPTYYREGVPRSILEALSVGMPIITTNSPGCKETIVDNKNGVLIAQKNKQELIDAMKSFIVNKNDIETKGIASRKLAETKFDVNIINKKLIEIIDASF